MAGHGKKYMKARSVVKQDQEMPSLQAMTQVKEVAYAGFDESVDVNVNLGIDPSKGDQVVRGSVVLPHGTGRQIKIVVFAKGDYAQEALKAGADYVGAEDLVEKIESGWLDFNYSIATPDLMGLVGKVARVLGPKGLLPNKKQGTVTFDIAAMITDLKKGRQFFKNDKNGIVHFSVGKISFKPQDLAENTISFLRALASSKPPSSKGQFIRKVTVSSTMGPGICINANEL
jgi:large subunit ribosomal protein L1